MSRHIVVEISPDPSLPVHDRKRITKEGEFLPFVKGGKEGFSLQYLNNYRLTIISLRCPFQEPQHGSTAALQDCSISLSEYSSHFGPGNFVDDE